MSSLASTRFASRFFNSSSNYPVLLCSWLLIILGAFYLTETVSLRQAGLWLVGVLLGITLYRSAFGFTHAWRDFIVNRRGAGMRAQMLMLALGVLLFFPFLYQGSIGSQAVNGIIAPAGLSVLLGAFIFGIGMQIGGGCASGTLFNAGSGNLRMLITLVFFIVGSLLAALHYPWWSTLPALQPISLVKQMGLFPALLSSLLLFAAVAVSTLYIERRRKTSKLVQTTTQESVRASLLKGPWPLAWGALFLVVLNFATLVLAGRPWGVVNAFPVWGSKIIMLSDSIDPTEWPYWMKDLMPLITPLKEDITSVMNFGLVLGAMAAAAAAGKFFQRQKLPARVLLASIIGGILLGYGSRLAFGCNIGAYFSGFLSGSLHAWLWFPAAFLGNIVGVGLRPWFGLSRE